jgi:hypothetical protein
MNKTHDYGEGFTGNQLEVLTALGIFTKPGSPKDSPFALSPPAPKQEKLVDPWDESFDVAERARSFLHATCAHCHVESGGGNSQMDLRSRIPLDRMKILREVPNHGTAGLPPEARLIVPGVAAQSVMVSRVARSTEGRMPPIGATTADPRATRLLIDWITSIKEESPSPVVPKK